MNDKGENERLAVVETEVKNVKELLEKVIIKLDDLSTKAEYTSLVERVSKLENRKTVKDTLTWVALVTSVLINVIMAYQLFAKG